MSRPALAPSSHTLDINILTCTHVRVNKVRVNVRVNVNVRVSVRVNVRVWADG